MTNKIPQKKAVKKKRIEKDITDSIYSLKDAEEDLKIREFKWTPKQLSLIDLITDKSTKICWILGVAGTSKTLVSVFSGLKLLKDKKINEIVYMRSAVESSAKSIGFLPGSLEEKVAPHSQALIEKMDELLPASQVNALISDQTVRPISNQFIRGLQWNGYIIVDEAQNFETFELITILTRLAEGGKMIILGDSKQADIKGKSGFMKLFELFSGQDSKDRGIHTFEFGKEDILRSKLLSFVCDKLDTLK